MSHQGPFTEVTDVDQLVALLGEPAQRALDKTRSSLLDVDRAWLAASPFCVLATASADGVCDASPKGDPAGWLVHVVDDRTIAIAERPGNRRADGYRNVLDNPHVGLLFVIPGRGDTLRVNGRARLVSDAPFFDDLSVQGHRPVLAVVVDIDEVFFHCAKAFLRSGLWEPGDLGPGEGRPAAGGDRPRGRAERTHRGRARRLLPSRQLPARSVCLSPIPFLKGHGTENDFVLLPDHDGTIHGELTAERVRALCDRRAGIGADGVLRVIRAEDHDAGRGQEAEWFMDYRNADGSPAEMCGNGIRVFARHLVDEGLVRSDVPVRIGTRDGVKTVTVDGDHITADLGTPRVLGETEVARSRAARGPRATSTSATPTRWCSSTISTRPVRCSSRRCATRRSTPTASTSSSSYVAATTTWRCGCTSGARARPGRAAPVRAPR